MNFICASTQFNAVTTLLASPAEGDLILVRAVSSGALTTPTGYSLAAPDFTDGNVYHNSLFYKIAGSSEPTTITLSAIPFSAIAAVFRGVKIVSVGAWVTSTAKSITVPFGNDVQTGDAVLIMTGDRDKGTASASGFTAVSGGLFSYMSTYDLYKIGSISGTSAAVSRTTQSNSISAISIVLRTPTFIRGTVKDESGAFAAREVRAYRRSDGVLSGATTSSSVDGTFSAIAADASQHYIIALPSSSSSNAIIFDSVTPVS